MVPAVAGPPMSVTASGWQVSDPAVMSRRASRTVAGAAPAQTATVYAWSALKPHLMMAASAATMPSGQTLPAWPKTITRALPDPAVLAMVNSSVAACPRAGMV
jgi:hypothetical protein